MAVIRGSSKRSNESDDRGQSEPLAVVLLFGITVIGATAIVAAGSMAILGAQDSTGQLGVEHAMTQFDSQAAIVALGDTDVQQVPLSGTGRGQYRIDQDAGWLRVTHVNHSGGGDEVFINESLGALIYSEDPLTIAYQGGGVWRSQGNGSSMISPPEFHYRGATLTLPLIRVRGASSAGGSPVASLTSVGESRRVFQNASAAAYGTPNQLRLNPITDGNVTVTVHSEYYDAWATFFRERTTGGVTVFHGNSTVEVSLIGSATVGDFEMPSEDNSISATSLGSEHPINNFTVTLKASNSGKNFQNMHWSFHGEKGGQELEIHLFSPGKCDGSDSYNDELDVSVYYYNGTTSFYQGWQNSSIDPASDDYFSVDCDETTLTANLTGQTALDYKAIDMTGGDNKWFYGSNIKTRSVDSSIAMSAHTIDTAAPRDGLYNTSPVDTESLGFVVNHYISKMGPNFDLVITDGPGGSDRIDEDASFGTLDYESSGGHIITFLHITENRISIEFR